MPKIIFASRYLRDAPPEQLENYVRYIATREGVEKIDESKRQLPATLRQKEFIKQLIRDIPQAKEMLEYTDFLLHPTIGNASELISCALEQHMDPAAKRENYVDYISNRPRVERVGEHGLFTDEGKAVVLRQVQEEVMRHKGAVWTHVISLRREDAARLGYDSAAQWMALLRSKRAMLCRHMKIDSANLRWYAAFHNESHHPHVHLMVYSAKDHDGYLTKQSIDAMRSELAHDIFRQDFAHIYEKQNQARAELKSQAADVMKQKMEALRSGTMVDPVIEKKMVQLSKRLQNTRGKKVYGYLKRDIKNLIDEIVDELAKDSRVDALYKAWGVWQKEIRLTYQSQSSPLPPLSRQQTFKSMKNMVIAEAMRLTGRNFIFEDEGALELDRELEMMPEETLLAENTVPEQCERYRLEQTLYTGNGTEKDDKLAAEYWEKAAKLGNVHTPYSLAKLRLGTDTGDESKTFKWQTKAADGGHAAAQYTLGKWYLAGEKIPKDVETAVKWLKHSAEQGNAYAQYMLGRQYLCGEDVPRDVEKALDYLQASAEQNNPYASYLLGKLYLVGEAVPKDVEAAVWYLETSAANGNPFAQYALGKLYLQGKEIPCDKEKAEDYLKASAAQGNLYAKFLLEHLDSFQDPSPFLATTRLLHRLEILFREDYRKTAGGGFYQIDRKRRRKLAEKKQAQGHKRDDHGPVQRID